MRVHPIPRTVGEPLSLFKDVNILKRHPDYVSAKQGDMVAASRFIEDTITADYLLSLPLYANRDCIFIAPSAIEASGDNRIPLGLARYCASIMNAQVDYNIIQSNQVYHTGANMMERLISPPIFEGDVIHGANYVIIDDVTTSGSTIAWLSNYIQENEGKVQSIALLANASRAATIHASSKNIKLIERRFGDDTRELFKIEPCTLTASEAGYLTNFRDADQLRKRVITARDERSRRLLSKGIQEQSEDIGSESKDRSESRDSAQYELSMLDRFHQGDIINV